MDVTATVFVIVLIIIVLLVLAAFGYFWYDAMQKRSKARQDMIRARADALVAQVAKRNAQHHRMTVARTSAAIQKQWLGKHRTGVPPEHKTHGRRVVDPEYEYTAGSPIEEQPIAEDMPPSPASQQVPISYEPILARKRTPSQPRVVTADVHEAAGQSIPMQTLSQAPLPVQLPMRRSKSPIGPAGVPMYRRSTPPPHGGSASDPGPKSGQLPTRKRSKSRESTGSGPGGSASYQRM